MADRIRTLDVLGEAPSFRDLLLLPPIVKSLADAGYVRPSPVQQASIPLARLGLDVIIQAKAGTGKTLVFAVAMAELIDRKATLPKALVLAPTREVALQAADVISEVASSSPLSVATLIGGLPTAEDERILRRRCHVVVGTPGRILSLIQRGSLVTQGISMLVLDEADKLLGADFLDDVSKVIESVPTSRQFLALSATYTPSSLGQLRGLMRQPHEIMLCSESTALLGVTHYYYDVTAAQSEKNGATTLAKGDIYELKRNVLLELLSSISFHQAIVFCNSKSSAEMLADDLIAARHAAACLSSDKDQLQRIEVLNSLRSYGLRAVVATDVAARGVDLDRVNLVVNFDLPAVPATLMHRVGRAGRFGTHGTAISLVQGPKGQVELQKAVTEAGGGEVLPLLRPIPLGWSATQPLLLQQTMPAALDNEFNGFNLPQKERGMPQIAPDAVFLATTHLNRENGDACQQAASTTPATPQTASINGYPEEDNEDVDDILGASLWPPEESGPLPQPLTSPGKQRKVAHHHAAAVNLALATTSIHTAGGGTSPTIAGNDDISEILESTLWTEDSGPLPTPQQWPLQLTELSPAMQQSLPITGAVGEVLEGSYTDSERLQARTVAFAPPTPAAGGVSDAPLQPQKANHYADVIASLQLDMERTDEASREATLLLERAFSHPCRTDNEKDSVKNIVVIGSAAMETDFTEGGTRRRRPLGSAQATAYTRQLEQEEYNERSLAEEAALLEAMAESSGSAECSAVGEIERREPDDGQSEAAWQEYWWQHYRQYGYWPGGSAHPDPGAARATTAAAAGAAAAPVSHTSGNNSVPGGGGGSGGGITPPVIIGGWSPSSGQPPDVGAVAAACADEGGYVKVPAQILQRYLELEWQDWQRRFFGGGGGTIPASNV